MPPVSKQSSHARSQSPTQKGAPKGLAAKESQLASAIADAIEHPTSLPPNQRRQHLRDAYIAAGGRASSITVTSCMAVLRRITAPQNKSVAVRVLDLLMDFHGDDLAVELAVNLRLLTNIAKKSLLSGRAGINDGSFPPASSDDDIRQFYFAVCELLDKYGRIYEESPSPLNGYSRARKELLHANVPVPEPSKYLVVDGEALVRRLGGGTFGRAPPVDPGYKLEKRELEKAFQNAKAAVARHGPQSAAAVEARSLLDSLLEAWQRAAREASEKDQFEEYERIMNLVHPYLESSAELAKGTLADVSTNASSSATVSPSVSLSPPPERRKSLGPSVSEKKKGSRGKAPSAERAAEECGSDSVEGWGAEMLRAGESGNRGFVYQSEASFGGNFASSPCGCSASQSGTWNGVTSTPGSHSGPLNEPCKFGQDGGQAGRSFGGSDFDCGRSTFYSAAQELVDTKTSQHGDLARLGLDGPPGLRWLRTHSSATHMPTFREEPLPAGTSVDEMRSLSGQLGHEREERLRVEHQLALALRRVRELEPLEVELADVRASLKALHQAYAQLQAEADSCRRNFRQASIELGESRDQLAERDKSISEARQRLFTEQQRTSRFEEALKNQSEANKMLLGQFHNSRTKQGALERELERLRKRHGWELPRQLGVEVVPSQPHGSEIVGVPKHPRTPSVALSDELASSVPQTSSRSRSESPRSRGVKPLESSLDEWMQTPIASGSSCLPQPPLVARSPVATREDAQRVARNFRALLGASRGKLYADGHISIEMVGIAGSAEARDRHSGLCFEILVTNCGQQPVHSVVVGSGPSPQPHACKLHLELRCVALGQSSPTGGPGVLRRGQVARFVGLLEIFAPYDSCPDLILSYLLPDDLRLDARLRLPLLLPRLLKPAASLDLYGFLERWSAFAQWDAAVVCRISRDILVEGTSFAFVKSIDFGGRLRFISGADQSPKNLTLAALYSQNQGTAPEVLVRVELGGPMGMSAADSASMCRVSVRSASHTVSRSVLASVLDALIDSAG